MKIIGLDNKEYSWNFTKYNNERQNCSSLHARARIILKQIFPYDIIYEEVILPGIKTEINNRLLIVDFYVHFPRIIIETQGEQHYKFVHFFYHNKLEYFRAKKLDNLKRQWCSKNEIQLIEFPYNESDIQWEDRIRNRT